MATNSLIFWPIKRAVGGFSTGSRSGIPYSYQDGQFLDFKSDPDSLGVLPTPTLDSSATITGLIKWIATTSGKTFLYDDLGNIYQRIAANNYTNLKTVINSAGQGMGIFADQLFYANANSIGRYSPLSGTSAFVDNVYALTNDAAFHPMLPLANKMCVGNGQTLATIDDAGIFVSAALTFLPSERVRCLAVWNTYLVIGTQFGNDDNSPYGNMYLWDGVSETYNDVIPTSGVVNSMVNDNGILTVWIGKQADLYTYNGTPLVKVKNMPKLTINDALTVNPGATGMWNNQVRFGTSLGTSSSTPKGIYTYGSQTKDFSKVLSYDYALSTGESAGTQIEIGAFQQLTPNLAIFSWRDASSVGIDRITTEAYATEATYQSLIFDAGTPQLRRKPTIECLITNDLLRLGEYIKFYLRKEGETDFTLLGQATYATNPNQAYFAFGCQTDVVTGLQYDPKGHQHEVKLVWGGTGTTRPVISSSVLSLEVDPDIDVSHD